MPWKETNAMIQREEFIREMLAAEMPFKHLCAKFGISEKTGHKWKKRFYESGKQGLNEQNRAPNNHPNSLPEDVIISIIKLREAHPYWGAKKVQELLSRANPEADPPSISSINRIIDKAGLVKRRRIKKASGDCRILHQHIQPTEVNDVWAIDFKGYWKSNGEICEPFTVRELVSRKILCVKLLPNKSGECVRAVMTELFKEYGLPKVIRSDNGTPFCSSYGVLSLTNLSAWWITLGIMPDRTEKGTPGQNGSLERMHADIAREIEGKIPGGVAANQIALDAWVEEYNSVRPNEAIGMQTPNEVFVKSPRKYAGDYDELEYPVGYLSRKVSSRGSIKLRSEEFQISTSLAGMNIGLRPADEANIYDVFLADFLLGKLDTGTYCFYSLEDLK